MLIDCLRECKPKQGVCNNCHHKSLIGEVT